MVFRGFSIIAFVVLLGCLFLHHLIFPCGYKSRFSLGSLIRKMVHLLTLLFLPQKLSWAGRFCKLAFLLGLLTFCVLALTGFGPLVFGGRLQGYLLMIHATFALVFIACAAVVAILAAGRYSFNKADAEAALHICKCGRGEGCRLTDKGIGAKAGFWFLLIMTLPVTLTMVLSMLPLFGPFGQEFLFQMHRWCALVFVLAAVTELYMLIRMGVIEDAQE